MAKKKKNKSQKGDGKDAPVFKYRVRFAGEKISDELLEAFRKFRK